MATIRIATVESSTVDNLTVDHSTVEYSTINHLVAVLFFVLPAVLSIGVFSGCTDTPQQQPQHPGDTTATVPAAAASRVCVPGERVGAVTASTSERELAVLYGNAHIRSGSIDEGEGLYTATTTLFPGTDDEVHIVWSDTTRSRPRRAIISRQNSTWRTIAGITIGTPLEELVQLNGRDCALSGFGWDYGGAILSWEGGALADSHAPGKQCSIRLAPSSNTADFGTVQGDRRFLSSLPAVRRLALRVSHLSIFFPPS